MPRTRTLGVLLSALALVSTGCSTSGPPELTVYADGTAIELAPVKYCDVSVQNCQTNAGAKQQLLVRPGKPVQLSVPTEVAESPWVVYQQAVTADGETLPVKTEYFGPGEAFAFTAQPARPDEQLLVIEVQQLGAAEFTDDSGETQILARGLWTLELRSR